MQVGVARSNDDRFNVGDNRESADTSRLYEYLRSTVRKAVEYDSEMILIVEGLGF